MKTVKIDVTQEDIDLGRPQCAYRCPVALAISRILEGKVGEVIVGDEEVHINRLNDEDFVLRTHSENVSGRIKTYDDTGKMDPFSFELELPDGLS